MPSSAVPHLASRVPLARARAPSQHPRPRTRQALQPSPSNRPRSRRDGHHTRSLHAARPWPRALLPGASSWGLGGAWVGRGGAWVAPGRLSGVCICMCMPMPMPMPVPMCRVCTCARGERIPPSVPGVAAALAQRADARRHRERAADGRAGELAGHSTLCVQPAAERSAASRRAGSKGGSWSGESALGRGARGHPPQPQPAPQHALPCRPALSPAEAQTANSSPGDACRRLAGRGAVCYPWCSPCRPAGGLSSSRRPSRSCWRARCDLEARTTRFASCCSVA
jgi:hypothetical protein